MSARRTKTKFTQIHVSIPVRLLEDLDEVLDFHQSRSRVISNLIETYLIGDTLSIMNMTTRQVMTALTAREDIDETLRLLLLQILTK